MYQVADRLVMAVEQGKLSRREAVTRLVAVAAAAFAAGADSPVPEKPAAAKPVFQSLGLNHIALRVADIPRSRGFYERHLGLEVLEESEYNCFMGAGKNNFVALFRAKQPGLSHYCYTIDPYRPTEVVGRLEAAGLEPRRQEDRVYFHDPDGIEVQLASEWGDYPRGRP